MQHKQPCSTDRTGCAGLHMLSIGQIIVSGCLNTRHACRTCCAVILFCITLYGKQNAGFDWYSRTWQITCQFTCVDCSKSPCLQACHKLANQVEACKQAVDIGLIGRRDPTIFQNKDNCFNFLQIQQRGPMELLHCYRHTKAG